jgi:hypothetical protein
MVRDMLRIRSIRDQWYLAPDFRDGLERDRIVDAINADIEVGLRRLITRGVSTPTQLLEAFVSEHRGSQYIAAQLLSVRRSCDVTLPFADRAALEAATRIPANVKVHNLVNRAILERRWPAGLKYPMAATLVPAGAPLLVQEASRAIRKAGEKLSWSLNSISRGRIPRPRLSWVDFEFLRGSQEFARFGGHFTNAIWDQPRINDRIGSIAGGTGTSVHPLYDQLGKMLTIQQWLAS